LVCKWKAALGALFATGICTWSLAYGQATGNDPRGASQIALAVEDAPPVPSRIVQPINEARLVQLRGNTHPSARSEFDRGPVDPQLPMQRMVLLLKRSPEQEAALEEFMARQLDPKSPDFHHWLEPADFGRIYGPSEADVAAVTNWLQNQDFTVDKVSNGRVFIEFSGTAAPSVTLGAKSLTFASTAKGTLSAVQTVTLTNAGTSTLYLTGITLTGTGAGHKLRDLRLIRPNHNRCPHRQPEHCR
jgi:hypothetical protein